MQRCHLGWHCSWAEGRKFSFIRGVYLSPLVLQLFSLGLGIVSAFGPVGPTALAGCVKLSYCEIYQAALPHLLYMSQCAIWAPQLLLHLEQVPGRRFYVLTSLSWGAAFKSSISTVSHCACFQLKALSSWRPMTTVWWKWYLDTLQCLWGNGFTAHTATSEFLLSPQSPSIWLDLLWACWTRLSLRPFPVPRFCESKNWLSCDVVCLYMTYINIRFTKYFSLLFIFPLY